MINMSVLLKNYVFFPDFVSKQSKTKQSKGEQKQSKNNQTNKPTTERLKSKYMHDIGYYVYLMVKTTSESLR